MSKFKKLLLGTILTVAAIALALALVACDNSNDEDDGYDKTIVYIGDSISEGILGPSPISERDSNSFYAIVGRNNNYRYIESAVSGDDTEKLYRHLVGSSTAAKERQYWIKQADILHLSILGNDVLVGNIGQNAYDHLTGNPTVINEQLERAAHYFGLAIERIKELNPNAPLLVNTLYNPIDKASTLFSESIKQQIIEYSDGDSASVRNTGTVLIGDLLNGIVYDYLEEHPGAYEVIDVYTAFDNIYKKNYTDGISLFYKDWMHPSNEGHAVIAGLIQAKLEELGLANKDFALERYKKLRTEQTDRLFIGTSVDTNALKAAIASAKTVEEVSSIYSKTVRGVIPIYVRGERDALAFERPEGGVFEQERFFQLSAFAYQDGTDYAGIAELSKSGFTFYPNGTFKFVITPKPLIIASANFALVEALKGGLDLSDILSDEAMQTGFGPYLQEVFPGLNIRYFEDALRLLTSCGLFINDLDLESENMQKLITSLEEDMVIPEGFLLPLISVELSGWYFINQTEEFTNIHMGLNNVSPDGFPLFFSTFHTVEDGEDWTETAIEVSKLIITCKEKKD
ncbi:MAG: SGNH/GDSL hydrolase family protein [Clostridia bacterium]